MHVRLKVYSHWMDVVHCCLVQCHVVLHVDACCKLCLRCVYSIALHVAFFHHSILQDAAMQCMQVERKFTTCCLTFGYAPHLVLTNLNTSTEATCVA